MDFDTEEGNVERNKTSEEELENLVSEADGKMDCQEGHVGSERLKKRKSSTIALMKIDGMKHELFEEAEEEEEDEDGRRKKKRRGRRMKSAGHSVAEANKVPRGRGRKRKRDRKPSENAEEKEKILGSDVEPIVGQEKEQEVETEKGNRRRRLSRGDVDYAEGEKLEGLNLSRQERYSLRTKKKGANSAPNLTKRRKDENVR